jgi:hypothetical protein
MMLGQHKSGKKQKNKIRARTPPKGSQERIHKNFKRRLIQTFI